VASWMWALLPYSIYISSSFVWETCLSALLLAVLFLWTLKLKEQPGGTWGWLGFGALWGFAALIKCNFAVSFPFSCWVGDLPVVAQPPDVDYCRGLVALGFVILLLPWQVRNYRTFHKLHPASRQFLARSLGWQ